MTDSVNTAHLLPESEQLWSDSGGNRLDSYDEVAPATCTCRRCQVFEMTPYRTPAHAFSAYDMGKCTEQVGILVPAMNYYDEYQTNRVHDRAVTSGIWQPPEDSPLFLRSGPSRYNCSEPEGAE